MQSGALAFIDVLGFKGIWKRADPDALLDKLRRTLHDTRDSVDDWNMLPAGLDRFVNVQAAFLSDTVAMGVAVTRVPEHAHYSAGALALRTLLLHVNELVRSFAVTEPPLAVRGCITIGKFIIDDQFILGPAVDQAAAHEREAEGAFVWLDPACRRLVQTEPMLADIDGLARMGLCPYSVPLKQGKQFSTYVVVPFTPQVAFDEMPKIAERILSTFDSPALDVVIKRDSTKRFLDEALERFRPG